MKQYIFILGHSPALSVAEIISVFPKRKAVFVSSDALIMELDIADVTGLMKRLGGTVKIGEVADKVLEKDLTSALLAFLKKDLPQGKLNFGLSFYGLAKPKLGLKIKKQLKADGLKARWVVSKNSNLSSADVTKSHLLKKGVEALVIKDGGEVVIGKTLAVQEFAEYSQRDYGRPARDSKSGLLPPKVAKMMINLAGVKESQRLIDPFCGSGTILQEALLMDYRDVWGSDASLKAIKDSRTNLRWLQEKLGIFKYDYNSRLKQIDAEKLSDYFKDHYFDAVITEPYLGPPLRGRETEREIKDIIKELSELYLKFFIQAKLVLKDQAKLVIIFPVFAVNNRKQYLLILDKLEQIGFKIKNPLRDMEGVKATARGSIIYSRPNQRVEREILVLEA